MVAASATAAAAGRAAADASGRGVLLLLLMVLGEGRCYYFLIVPTLIISKSKFKTSLVKKCHL